MTKAKALTAYLAERQPAPFSWPLANCAHFAGAFVAKVEGRDPLASIKMPATLAAARRLQVKGGGLERLATAALGRQPISAKLAQVGDVVLLQLDAADPHAQALGLCCGEHAVFVMGSGATGFASMTGAVHAWRVSP